MKIYKYSEERRKNMSEARKRNGTSLAQLSHLKIMQEINRKTGRTSNGGLFGKDNPNFGKHWSEDVRTKMGKKNIGKIPPNKGVQMSKEQRKKISIAMTGKPSPLKGIPKEHTKGKNHWNWKGGINPINDTIRKSLDYKLWREAVFKRDKWTCQECSQVGYAIEAHHIKPFALFPELRFAIDNGRTLCRECHMETPTYAGKVLNYKTSIN